MASDADRTARPCNTLEINPFRLTRWAARSTVGRRTMAGLFTFGLLITSYGQAEVTSTATTPAKTIVLINPNSSAGATTSMVDLAQTQAGDTAKILGITNDGAAALLTTPHDMATAAQGVVQRGVAAAKDPNVAVIIVGAFSDPGLDALRAAVQIPVLGIGEEAFHQAARGGRQFGIVTVTPDPALIESFQQKAASLGYQDLYRGVRVTPGDPTELVASPDKLDAALSDAVHESIALDGSRAVIMGGGPLSASGLRIAPQFDVPLVVAVNAAVDAAKRFIDESE